MPADLTRLLEEARVLGHLGPDAVEHHIDHSLGFMEILDSLPPDISRLPLLDLGSGGGVPGLVLAVARQPRPIVLLDGSVRRCTWLRSAVDRLGVSEVVEVVAERAEVAGKSARWRHGFGMVVARLFGRPAVTAECAAPFLGEGGILVVSDARATIDEKERDEAPRDAADGTGDPIAAESAQAARWPSEGLAELGLGSARPQLARGYSFITVARVSPCCERYPRRTGIPTKRPLF